MTLTPEDREIRVRDHLEMSEECLNVAHSILDMSPRTSVFSSYQAAFNATLALFIRDGIEMGKKHKALGSLLSEIYIRGEGSLPEGMTAILHHLAEDRNIGTYRSSAKVTKEQAEKNLEDAEKYCSVIKTLIQKKTKEHSSDQNLDALEKEVQDLHLMKPNNAKIYTKPNELIEYKGEILHVNESKGYSVQKTGNITLFVHKNEKLERKPEVGEVLKIKYKGNEKATIKSVERDHKKQQGLSR